MEPAIPAHLTVEPTRDKRISGDYQPPYPSFVARHKRAVKAVVMAYFGVQFRAPDRQDGVAAQERIARAFKAPTAPDIGIARPMSMRRDLENISP